MILQCNKKNILLINKVVFFKYGGAQIYFSARGRKNKPVNIFLHGWGQSGDCFKEIIASLPGFYNIAFDFPPFGKSGEAEGFTIFSYVEMLIAFCEQNKITKCNLIGHSFGGRVAILVSALRNDLVDRLVLIASAGMKPKRKLSYFVNVFCYKCLKFLGCPPKNAGSSDYKKLSAAMQKTFVNVVNTHLEEYCPLIEAETLIIFGENDNQTPIYMAKRLKKLIKNSQLVVLKHAGHFCFIERKIQVCQFLQQFLKEDK